MFDIHQIGYMPAYGVDSSYRFTKQFNIHVSVSFDTVKYDPDADFRVLVQCEPPKLYVDFYGMVDRNKHHFNLILSYDDRILNFPNAKEFLPIGCWINSENLDKRNQITYIMSSKILTHEHRMRFMILRRFERINQIGQFELLMHRSPPRIQPKEIFFNNAKFHVVCENQVMNNMFTEKLVDCFKTRTIPIYYGCLNIDRYFNPKGIIRFYSIEEFDHIINNLTPEIYDEMTPYIDENYERAKIYWEKNVYQRIEDMIERNM